MQDRWGVNIRHCATEKRRVCWTKPAAGRHKLNTDGSLRNGTGWWAAVIRNEEGVITRVAHGRSKKTSIDGIELDAVFHGMILARKYNITHLDINVDSTAVVQFLKTGKSPWV